MVNWHSRYKEMDLPPQFPSTVGQPPTLSHVHCCVFVVSPVSDQVDPVPQVKVIVHTKSAPLQVMEPASPTADNRSASSSVVRTHSDVRKYIIYLALNMS